MSDDVVDVAEEEKEEAPIVTVAHTIEAIPSPPRSPFRFVAIIVELVDQSINHDRHHCHDHDHPPGLSFQTSLLALEPSQLSPSSHTSCLRYIVFVDIIIIFITIIY